MSFWMPPTSTRLYPPHKLAKLVTLLVAHGVSASAALDGTGLDAAALDDSARHTSIDDHLAVCRNAIALVQDGGLALRAGARSQLCDHGVYGLLLLSSETVRDCFSLADMYQLLAAPLVAMQGAEQGGDALRILDVAVHHAMPHALRVFLIAQQAAQQVALLDEVLGRHCRPTLACFNHPAPPQWARYAELLQCPCVFDWHRTELRYPIDILAQRPQLANPLAATVLQASCDALVADIETSAGVAGEVYRVLRRLGDPGISMKAVASSMQITDRTLRRRLADEGTSFSTIAHDVKYRVATQHLTGSRASIEQVAAIAGFSDSANFRRAFIRWTNISPAQYRRLQSR